jgi:cell division protein FtsI/penicillin-binding protein 2
MDSWTSNIGPVDARSSLAWSSNAYMIETFSRLSKWSNRFTPQQADHWMNTYYRPTLDKIWAYHAELGLGKTKTGIDLPYEAEGIVSEEKYPADVAFASFGQSEFYTLMQMAQYVATIANDGKRMEPHVVKEIIAPDGTVKKIEPKVLNETSFSQEHLKVVQEGMRDVVEKYYGTFHSVLGKYPIPVAGKTGTAETLYKGKWQENSLFVGYAPYDDPKIAVAVIIPYNKVGSHSYDSVGPIAKAMFDAFFNLDEKKEKDGNEAKKN